MDLTAFGEGHPGLPGEVLQSGAASQEAANSKTADRISPALINAVLATRLSIRQDAASSPLHQWSI
jgi:hypothetical protein